MSSVYTPNASNNPSTYTLPSDIDDATAESVNVALRALADKTHHAYQVFAQLAASNTFTAAQVINAANGYLEVAGTGTWKLILMGHTGVTDGSQEGEVHLHTNTGGTYFGALTCNAYWTGSVWRQQANTYASTAILFSTVGFEVARMAAGAADWTTWSIAPSALTAGDIYIEGGVLYNSPKTRTTPVPVTVSRGGSVDAINGNVVAGGVLPIWFTIRLPANAVISTLQVMTNQASSSTSAFDVYKRDLNWSSPTGTVMTSVGGAASSTSTGIKVTSISLSSHVVSSASEYVLRWAPGDAADELQGVRALNWLDPGPQNVWCG